MITDKEYLEKLITVTKEAALCILNEEKVVIQWPELLNELQLIEKTKNLKEIARKEYSILDIMNKLKISGILEQYEKVLEVIHLEDSIVPAGVQQALDEERVKHNGEIWIIHKSDKDPFPSNPHAHNYEKRLKMDLGSGELYKEREGVSP